MKQLLWIMMVGVTLSYGAEAEVKKADVTLLVDDVEVHHHAGDKFPLNGGEIVCFKEGKGRVVITAEGWRKQLSRHTKGCKHLPVSSKEKSHLIAHATGKVVALFSQAKEDQVAGVSRKSAEVKTVKKEITLPQEAKYLLVENNAWGPLPVTLTIIDKTGKTVETMVNEEDVLTSFVIPRNMLKEGYVITVKNAFDEVLVESIVHTKHGEE